MTLLVLKLHRWVALVFALPLLVVLGTGLVLSFEPSIVVGSINPAALDATRVEALLARHDAAGRARALVYRSYDNTLTISARGRGGTTVDVGTGEKLAGPGVLANVMVTSRRLHETLLLDLGWLVIASTVAMLALVVLGLLQGWPRFSNSISGWHKAIGWLVLPLVVLSPLTGLLIAAGVTLTGPQPVRPGEPGPGGAGPTLVEAVRVVGRSHDLSGLVWLRERSGRMLARVVEGGEYRVYVVGRDRTTATQRNWPRLWHEGNFAGHISALLNVITSFAIIGLLVTGVWIWARRQWRRRARRTVAA